MVLFVKITISAHLQATGNTYQKVIGGICWIMARENILTCICTCAKHDNTSAALRLKGKQSGMSSIKRGNLPTSVLRMLIICFIKMAYSGNSGQNISNP